MKLPSCIAAFGLLLFCLQACENNAQQVPGVPGEKINMQAPYYSNKVADDNPRVSKRYDSSKMSFVFPFTLYNDGSYLLSVEVEDTAVFEQFNPLFEKYGYTGSGYSWDGIIREIVEKEQPDLKRHISFDAEAGGYYAFADCASNQRKFAEAVAGVFADKNRLEKYIREADKSKIDD